MVLIESIFHPSFCFVDTLGSIFWYDANALRQFRYLLFVFFYLQAIVRLQELLLVKVTLRERKLENSWKMFELHSRRFVVTMCFYHFIQLLLSFQFQHKVFVTYSPSSPVCSRKKTISFLSVKIEESTKPT